MDESLLTGESKSVEKCGAPLPERRQTEMDKHQAFMGTLVAGGSARGIVMKTAKDTEFGKIASQITSHEKKRTPLQLAMDDLGHRLSLGAMALIAMIVFIGWMHGMDLFYMFKLGLTLAVAAIPEGLPICTTITLALGVIRMAKKHAIVRNLPAVEVLGCTTTLCLDKTGTLTENNMTARLLLLPLEDAVQALDISAESEVISLKQGHKQILLAGTVCNNCILNGDHYIGSSTEKALAVVADKLGVKQQSQRIHEMPFSSESKYMGVWRRWGWRRSDPCKNTMHT